MRSRSTRSGGISVRLLRRSMGRRARISTARVPSASARVSLTPPKTTLASRRLRGRGASHCSETSSTAGLRRREVLTLRHIDANVERGTIRIEKGKGRGGGRIVRRSSPRRSAGSSHAGSRRNWRMNAIENRRHHAPSVEAMLRRLRRASADAIADHVGRKTFLPRSDPELGPGLGGGERLARSRCSVCSTLSRGLLFPGWSRTG